MQAATTAQLVPPSPPLFDETRLAVSGFLARYSGTTRAGYATDLRAWFAWCAEAKLEIFGVRRAVNGQVVVPAGGQQKSPPLGRDQTFFGPGRPPFERASFMRKDSPSVTTTTAWWSRRSRRLTAVVCSGRKRPQSSKGQCEPMPRERRS